MGQHPGAHPLPGWHVAPRIREQSRPGRIVNLYRRTAPVAGPCHYAAPSSARRPGPDRGRDASRLPLSIGMPVKITPWFILHRPRPAATHRLFCFPYAGAGSLLYRRWALDLPDWIEVVAVELPGRQTRFSEAPPTSLDAMTDALATATNGLLDKPFGIFGYSFGSVVGIEWLRELDRRRLRGPIHAFCAAHRAPHVAPRPLSIHRLSEPELIDWLKTMGGTPDALLSEPDWLRHFLRALRADLALAEGYCADTPFALRCGLTVFGGLHDPHVDIDALREWRRYSDGPFSLHRFDGDHFFIHARERELQDHVVATLAARA
ncbi:thioesterase II family protein [Burkholderia sp. MSMB1078WGS]|uniref:thioesterase II family protein n=1 Tax=Burkholderia sp. MSMB1078WGS TaxID=1637900 RepID=UPI0012E39E86|nr:thioesterase domain-containing protein [Burkholderia sp. MSMB1078WGS]